MGFFDAFVVKTTNGLKKIPVGEIVIVVVSGGDCGRFLVAIFISCYPKGKGEFSWILSYDAVIVGFVEINTKTIHEARGA